MDLLTFLQSKRSHGDGAEAGGVIHTSHPGGQGQLPGYLVPGIQGRNVWEPPSVGVSEEPGALTTQ